MLCYIEIDGVRTYDEYLLSVTGSYEEDLVLARHLGTNSICASFVVWLMDTIELCFLFEIIFAPSWRHVSTFLFITTCDVFHLISPPERVWPALKCE